jgi:hypothetical protein
VGHASLSGSINRQLRLAARPSGLPERSDWQLTEEPVPVPGAGEFVVANSHISVDPATLLGQTVVVIGGSSKPGPSAAGRRRVGVGTAAFDATDFDRLTSFFDELPTPIDHVLVTGPGPYYAPLGEIDFDKARRSLDAHLLLPLQIARSAVGRVRPGGTLLFIGGTGGRRPSSGALITALTAANPALIRNLIGPSRPTFLPTHPQ